MSWFVRNVNGIELMKKIRIYRKTKKLMDEPSEVRCRQK
jgi:hypothetical protein